MSTEAYAGSGANRRRSVLGCSAIALLLCASQLSAETPYIWETHDQRVDSARQIRSGGAGMFGEQIDLQVGGLGFRTTDVDIPGNNSLPVQFTRSYQVMNSRARGDNGVLADWQIELPRITGVFATEWLAGSSTNRCSSYALPALPPDKAEKFQLHDFWRGVHLQIPGVASGELVVPAASAPKPTNVPPTPYRWSVDGHIHLYCLPSLQSGTGEGFVAVTPDGTRYWFNRMAQRPLPGTSVRLFDAPDEFGEPIPAGTYTLNITENALYATRIEDRFGNHVSIEYENAPNQVARPTTILSSDGRQIEITYSGSPSKVHQVRAGTVASPDQRVWTYTYSTDSGGRQILSGVALPDTTSWAIGFGNLTWSPIAYEIGPNLERDCFSLPTPQNWAPDATQPSTISGSITHPSGATATYYLDIQEHNRAHVNIACTNFDTDTRNVRDDYPLFVAAWHTWTLYEKRISGPGMSQLVWTYAFDSDRIDVFAPGTTYDFPVCTTAACYQPTCTEANCSSPGVATALVTQPDSTQQLFTFGNNWQFDEGKLLSLEHKAADGTLLERITHEYDLSRANRAYPARYGSSLRGSAEAFQAEYHRPKFSTVVDRSGDTFSWEVECKSTAVPCHGDRHFDLYARAERVTKESSLGYVRAEQYAYHDHASKWILGQLSSVVVDGITASSATYEPTYAQLSTLSAFGQLQQTLTYHTSGDQNGAVASVKDANNQITTLSSWKRGVPQSISHPGGASQSAIANDFGEVTSVTNEMGFTTSFSYDSMGRLSSITHPNGDPVSWAPTTIVYAKVGSVEYGIPGGHWRRTETTGTRVSQTFYDGLWRPILDRQYATDSSVGNRFVRRGFNHRGQETFASYPVASVSSYTSVTSGTSSSYDALGRITGTSSQSELGTITTSTEYLSPFQVRTTNGRGFSTTTTFQAFGQPTYDFPIQVRQPEGVTTTYTRDVFGKPLTLSRSGSYTPPGGSAQSLSIVRRFVYDPQQRLCKTIEPDAGTTVMNYDAAGNLLWRASGQNGLSSISDCQRVSVPISERSVHRYDSRNRLLFVDHPTGTDDVGYTWFDDGAMATATTGTLNASVPPAWSTKTTEWTYGYNRRRLLTSESLLTFGRTFALSHVYNTRGDLEQQTYPSGLTVGYLPNAYGEPRQAGGYAHSVGYHVNGTPAAWTYGNGAVRNVTLNARQLPSRIRDVRSGVVLFDHQLSYDRNANLASLIDGQPSAWETRTLGYDQKDRLTSVGSASQGNEAYTYDVLDNLRRYVRGSQDKRFNYSATSGRLDSITFPSGTPDVHFGWNNRGELTSKGRQSFPDEPPPGRIFYGSFEEGTGTGTASFTFDKAGRLVSYLNGAANYWYDAHGLRVRTSASYIGNRYHVYSRAGKLVYAQDEGRDQRSDFIYLGDTLVAQRDRSMSSETATTTYLHSDYRGTPSVETSSGGALLRRNLLKAYGDPYDGQRKEGPGFTKHANDTIVGMVYMQQRYYDPEAMRFISVDPLSATPDRFNTYWYANNNPYSFIDPDGRQALDHSAKYLDLSRRHNGNADSMLREVSAGTTDGLVVAVGVALMAVPDPTDVVVAGALGTRILPGARAADEIVDAAKGPSVGDLRKAGQKDAHHIIQDAAVRDVPGYDTNRAPGIQLPGPASTRGTPHNLATQVQRGAGGGTYASERRIAYKALRRAGLSPSDARAAVERADRFFQSLGVGPTTPTRVPGNRR